MHVFRYDTEIGPDGSTVWRYLVHSEEGHLFRVVITQRGTHYRWDLEGARPSSNNGVETLFASRSQALEAARAYLVDHAHRPGACAG